MIKKRLVILIILIAVTIFIFMTYEYFDARRSYRFDGVGWCSGNLVAISRSIDYYANSNRRYPDKLQELTPDYIRIIPTCAASGTDTYSQSYSFDQNRKVYTIFCKGHYHPELGTNLPRYDSQKGLYPRKRLFW